MADFFLYGICNGWLANLPCIKKRPKGRFFDTQWYPNDQPFTVLVLIRHRRFQ